MFLSLLDYTSRTLKLDLVSGEMRLQAFCSLLVLAQLEAFST